MKLRNLKVRNFRCCEEFAMHAESMHALVGTNNAGKSTVLHALDMFFNPSTKKLNEESFFKKDLSRRIEIEAVFDELTDGERLELAPYLKADGSFHVMRTAEVVSQDDDESADSDAKFRIQAHYAKELPKVDWLNPSRITGASIQAWWADKSKLKFNDQDFASMLGSSRPNVGTWKEKALEFSSAHLGVDDYELSWIENPQGYAGVLKSTLPHFEMIPAVREATDESRVTKTNPFGRLIYEIVNSIDAELKQELEDTLSRSVLRLNRSGEAARAPKVVEIERTIKGFLSEIMPVDLELQFQAPAIEVILTTPKILVDDGFSGGVDGKGHGLQRAVIFAILRSYAKLVTDKVGSNKRTLILGVEEPELYMHPTAQRTIRKVLRSIADGGDQVFITTHSPLMVDVEFFDEIVRVEPAMGGGSPRPYQLPVSSLIEDLVARYPGLAGRVTPQSIREKYRHAYTSTRNEGFFAKTVVLVEGATEVYALPIYAAALGFDFDLLSIAVVECGGKGQIDRLYRVFNELGIPCYALFDFDIDNLDANLRRETRDLLSLLGGDHVISPTSAVVEPSFACFRKDWEADLAPEMSDYASLREEARSELGLRDPSKPLVARFVASKISSRGQQAIPVTLAQIVGRIVAVQRTSTCLSKVISAPVPTAGVVQNPESAT